MLDDYGLAWELGAPVGAKGMCIAWQSVQPKREEKAAVFRHYGVVTHHRSQRLRIR